MKFFTASIPARLLAAFNLFDNSRLQIEHEKIYNNILQTNYKNAKINNGQVKIYKNELKLSKKVPADLL